MATLSNVAEWKALVEKIKESRFLKRENKSSKEQREILDFLFDNRDTLLSGSDIEVVHFKHREYGKDFDEDHPKAVVFALNATLKKYRDANTDDKWICEVPNAKDEGGYHLVFKERPRPKRSATELFWQPHLERAEKVLVVSNTPLFFYDAEADSMVRFSDVNVNAGEKEAMGTLKARHSEVYREGLEIVYPYMPSGAAKAADVLLRWFHDRKTVLINRCMSVDVVEDDVQKSSAILLGRPASNIFIETVMKSTALGYRFDKYGAVRITPHLTDPEKASLSAFSITENLVESPKKWETVFGIVSRVPKGRDAITVIAADFNTRAVLRIVELLTDDAASAELFARLKWPLDREVPRSFEMLFGMESAPGNIRGGGPAELLCARVDGKTLSVPQN